jgi:hypothetical protein
LSCFLKNNIKSEPDLSRNCRFSAERPAALSGAFAAVGSAERCGRWKFNHSPGQADNRPPYRAKAWPPLLRADA